MKLLKYITFALVLGCMGFTSSAQKIGYMDYSMVRSAHPSFDTIKFVLNNYESEMERKLTLENENFQAKYKEYIELSQTPGVDTNKLRLKERTLLSLKEEFDFNQKDARIKLEQMQNRLIDNLHQKINVFVEIIAKEKGMTYVIDNSSGVLVVKDPKGDITELVMKRMGLTMPVTPGE